MWRFKLFVLGISLAIASCAGPSKVVAVPPGELPLEIKASSFAFDPNVIQTHLGNKLILDIENVSNVDHNFMIKTPTGEVLVTKDLPAHQIVRLEIPLTQLGEYPFNCDKPFHTSLGMSGRLVVEK